LTFTIEPEQTTPQPDLDTAPMPDIPSRYGPKNRDLPKQLKDAIRAAVIKAQNQERYLRRLEVLHDRRNRFYERGHQHIYEGRNDLFVLAVPGATWSDSSGSEQEWGDYIDDYNIFHGFQWIITSVLTQSPTGIAFEPIDPSRDEDSQAATTAEGLRKHFDRMNDVRKYARDTVRMMCLSGRFIRWVRIVEDATKFGRNDDGTPKKECIMTVHGCLESKVPIMARSQEEFPYLILYDDLDIRNARQEYWDIRDNLKAGETALDENNYERFARLGVLQGARSEFQAGEAISHLITRANVWLRPSVFSGKEFDEPFDEAQEEDLIQEQDDFGSSVQRTPTVREKLQQMFPEGLHAVFVGQTFAECWAESMDDCLFTGAPFSGDGQFAMAIMDPAIVIQDKFNDQMNYVAETFDFGAPSSWINSTDAEFASYVDQKAQPFGIRQLKKVPQGMKAADMFFREPNPEIPATLQPYIQFLMGELLQFILACPPAVWGETSPDNKTASGLAQSRNQALGRLGVLWSVLQKADARMYYQVALALQNDPETPEHILVPQKDGQTVTIEVERLRKGHFMARPDEDSGFPDSTNAIRSVLTQVFGLAAQFPALVPQLFTPDNLKQYMRVFGLSNLVLPEAESRDKQQMEIEMLLDGVPVQPTPEEIQQAQTQWYAQAQAATVMGAPMPPPFDPTSLIRSSVPITPWDFDQWEMQKCDDFLNSDAARIELQIGRMNPATGQVEPNQRGVQNVWLHREEHRKAIMAKTPQMTPNAAQTQMPMQHAASPMQQQPHTPKATPPSSPIAPAAAPAGSPTTQTV
jgi:hypothetical protein